MAKVNKYAQAFADSKNVELEVYCNIYIIEYIDSKERPSVAIFQQRSRKPFYHYCFVNNENRADYIKTYKKSAKIQYEQVLAWGKEFQDRIKDILENAKEGDIFYSDWGYEQTNINWYQVIGKKGEKTFLLREVKSKKIMTGDMGGKCTPDKDNFRTEEIYTCRPNKFGGFKIGHSQTAYKWDGKEKRFSEYA